jgi:hypothetical protein
MTTDNELMRIELLHIEECPTPLRHRNGWKQP